MHGTTHWKNILPNIQDLLKNSMKNVRNLPNNKKYSNWINISISVKSLNKDSNNWANSKEKQEISIKK